MQEHIEQLQALRGDVPHLYRLAIDAAIELMNAAKPLDEAAEREHCEVLMDPHCNPTGYEQLVDALMRERAQARAEGYMQARAKYRDGRDSDDLGGVVCRECSGLDDVQTELATLKREHEQLRAAVQTVVYTTYRQHEMRALRAALDATLAEPVRETFDPDAVRALLRCVFNMSHASSQAILAAEAVRGSERK